MTIPCDLIKNYGWGTSFATFTMFRIVFWLVWLSCLIIYDFSAPHRLPPKRVTLTDPHVKDAARGGSVNEGRMVKTPTSTYSHTSDGCDHISSGLWEKNFGITKRVKKRAVFESRGGSVNVTREEWWRPLRAHLVTQMMIVITFLQALRKKGLKRDCFLSWKSLCQINMIYC